MLYLPVASTVCEAGKPCTIKWQDNGKTPTLAEMGDVLVGVYAGGAQQQTMMQNLGATNAASASTIQFTPDPAMGEDSDAYFIKMVSVSRPDAANPSYKESAYSAKFALKGMTGKFSPMFQAVQAQIAGTGAPSTETPPVGTSTSTDASSSSKISTTRTSTSSTASGTPANSNNTATNSNSAGSIAVGMGMFGATVLAAFAAVL
ncbi:GPI-anchored domain-containing protein [Rhizoctonia solani AG-1 IA]|uniref:GPI-anchored domain-containing protein n=1 Tax=Thanatephorus cucumeris (strain AG1-IA) TaxID=983506 RepID=L8WD12_THACA|nr:GPI-anchored domain-containing protein [Rhizoctonia solani AG-1 IA]